MNRFITYFTDNEEKHWHLLGMVESIKPTKVDYELIKNTNEIEAEFFDGYTKNFYKVVINIYGSKAEVIFGEKSQFGLDDATPEDLKTANNKPFKVLGQVMYIISDILRQRKDIKIIYFTAYGKDLERVYDKMVKNTHFLRSLKDFSYIGKLGEWKTKDEFTFKRNVK